MLFKNTEVNKYISHILILHIRGRWSSQGGAPSVVGGEFRPESSIVLDRNIQDPLILVFVCCQHKNPFGKQVSFPSNSIMCDHVCLISVMMIICLKPLVLGI